MRLQLWSYNYDPEPQGIAPLSGMLARSLRDMGHELTVVAAHPHYPEPDWGIRLRPYREEREGIPVIRLPLWPGRNSGLARIRQDLTFTACLAAATPMLPKADAAIVVTPSFPALLPAMVNAKLRGMPWIMWLQDIVTDGAATTGELSDGRLLKTARHFEKRAYAAADKIVVISDAFRHNLLSKGVPELKIERIFNPTSRVVAEPNDIDSLAAERPQALAMGNIGHSQGLDQMVKSFQANRHLAKMGARFVIAGSGVAVNETKQEIRSDRIKMPGVLHGDELTPVLRRSSIGLVSQRAGIAEFNLPSKLMNYMAFGVPVIASVNPESETARIVRDSGCGWVTDSAAPEQFAEKAVEAFADRSALVKAGQAGFDFAQRQFAPSAVASQFDRLLNEIVVGREMSTAALRTA